MLKNILAKSFHLKTLFLTLVLVLTCFGLVTNIFAFSDPADIFTVSDPGANSTLRGSQDIRFEVYDNEQSSVATWVRILDSNCQTKVRTIFNANKPSTKTSQVISWNTTSGYTDGGALADGLYCLSVCVNLKYQTTPYTTCNQRKVTIRNTTNQAPYIRSLPTTKIYLGENYNYQIKATDPDNDPLTYSLLQKPSFLTLQGNTLKATNVQSQGSFFIKFRVTDNYGGFAEQSYSLVVSVKPTPTPVPATTSTPAATPTPTPTPSNAFELKIDYPTATSVLSGKLNNLQWSYRNLPANLQNGDSLILEAKTKDTDKWAKLTEVGFADIAKTTNFNWDVNQLANGEYQIKLTLKQGSTLCEAVSSVFKIDNSQVTPTPSNEISLSNLKPDNGSSISELRPEIAAQITSGQKLDQAAFKVALDDKDLTTSCTWQNRNENNQFILNFNCKLSADLALGEHKVKVSSATFTKEWSFALVAPDTESISILGIKLAKETAVILLTICILFLCLILLPFILFSIWRRRQQNREEPPYVSTTPAVITTKTTVESMPINKTSSPLPQNDPAAPFVAASYPKTTTSTNYLIPTKLEAKTEPKSEPKNKIAPLVVDNNVTVTEPKVDPEPLSAAAALTGAPLAPITMTTKPAEPSKPIEPEQKKSESSESNGFATVETPEPTVTPAETAATPTPAPSSDDLPDWLKDIPSVADEEIDTKKNDSDNNPNSSSNSSSSDTEDGSDPYGLGDFTI